MMKILKKSVLLLMSIVMAVQLAFPVFAESYEDNTAMAQRAYNFLDTTGIIAENSHKLSDTVSREYFAYAAARTMRIPFEAAEYKGIFTDVDKDNEYAGAIESMAMLGLLSGYGDGIYGPKDDMLGKYAAKVLVVMTSKHLNITDTANIDAFTAAARLNGYMDNTTGNEPLSYGDLYIMLYNLLHSDAIGTTYKGDGVDYYYSETTILYQQYKMFFDTGIIISNDITSLWAKSDLAKGQISVKTAGGTLVLDASKFPEAADDIGKSVRVYFTAASKNVRTLEYYETDTDNTVTKIKLSDIDTSKSSLASGKLTYYTDNSKEKILRIDAGCDILYNGVFYAGTAFNFNSLNGKSGSINAIDNDGDNTVEVLSVEVNQIMMPGNIYSADGMLADKYDKTNTVIADLTEADRIEVYDAEGKKIENTPSLFADIPKDTVITIKESIPATGVNKLRIDIVASKASGKITSIVSRGGNTEITLDTMGTYRCISSVRQDILKLGNSVDLYLDENGDVCYATQQIGRNLEYGLAIRLAYPGTKKSSLDPDRVQIEYISMSGELVTGYLADNVKIDGISYKDKLNEVVPIISSLPQINLGMSSLPTGTFAMRYRLNNEDEIAEIDTVSGSDTNGLTLIDMGQRPIKTAAKIIGYKTMYNDNTVVMNISADDYSTVYGITNRLSASVGIAKDMFAGKTALYCAAFKCDESSFDADFVLMGTSSVFNYDTPILVVDEIMQSYDSESGESYSMISGYSAGKNVKLRISKEKETAFIADSLKKGEVLRYTVNGKGEITDYEFAVRLNSDNSFNLMQPSSSRSDFSSATSEYLTMLITSGYVYDKKDGVISINIIPMGNNKTYSDCIANIETDEKYLFRVSNIVVYDKSLDKIYLGDEGDIIDYMTNGTANVSRVFVGARAGIVNNIIVYNE